MKHNKILVILMAIALLIGTFVSAAAAGRYAIPRDGDEDQGTPPILSAPETPHVAVKGYPEDPTDSGYFELSLKVSAREFQTVGVVLSYNSSVLTPIQWSSGEKNEDGSPKDIAIDPAKSNSWNSPVVLPSRGADGLAGKPALSYAGYDVEKQEPTGRGYLYLGADTLQYGDLIGERVVTVRFRKDVGVKVTMPESPDTDNLMDEKFTVCLASEPISLEAIPGHPLLLTAQGEDRLPMSYTSYRHIRETDAALATQEAAALAEADGEGETETTPTPEPEPTPAPELKPEGDCTLSFSFGDIESADSSGGSGDYAITFFDWDGRVIDAIAAPENAEEAVAKWQSQQWIQERLGNKKGYAFDQWLIVQQVGGSLETKNGTFTSNDTPLDLTDSKVEEDVATSKFLQKLEPTLITDTEEESHSLLLQAAYKAKTTDNGFSTDLVNGGSNDNLERYYTISEPVYTRLGAADKNGGSYSLTMTVTRKKGENGVTRLQEPAIWVSMTPTAGGDNILNLIKLENTDETTFEIVTNKQINEVTCKVVDTYQVSNWRGCGNKSDNKVKGRQECVSRGTQGYLAQQAYLAASSKKDTETDVNAIWDAYTESFAQNNAWIYADCFYDTNNARASDGWWTTARITKAREKLIDASGSGPVSYDKVLQLLGEVT